MTLFLAINPELWRRVEEHFDTLVLQSPHAQQAGLQAIADPWLRGEVEALLQHAGDTAPVGDAIAAAAEEVTAAQSPEPEGPQRIGPYRVVGRIGRGGQGVVYEAQRDDGAYRKRVAIKIIPWELDSDATRQNFRRERDLLAQLEHPCIARLLEGGDTPNGAPYLVMEFVEGRPITKAAASWSREAKLRLFLRVAEAVEYAHRHLIVHRDLKPNNVLVTADGTPKLLDFGIAKLVDKSGPATVTAVWALTPDYASPEQVLGLPISTASDVYSLGILLYELLIGTRPYSLETSSPVEVQRVICQVEPPVPHLSPDLDSIILMALRKEPDRRYNSVRGFALDIENYLARKPVQARPDSWAYRVRKFTARHWLPLSAAALALACILGFAGAAVYQARIAQRQAEIARTRVVQLRNLTHREIFAYYEDLARLRGTAAVREAMMGDAIAYLDQLADVVGDDPAVLGELAAAYKRAGDAQGNARSSGAEKTDAALASYRHAMLLYQRAVTLDPAHRPQFALFLVDYTDLLRVEGQIEDAKAVARQSVENWRQIGQSDPQSLAAVEGQSRAWYNLGRIAADEGEFRNSLAALQQGWDLASVLLARRNSNDDLAFAGDLQVHLAKTLAATGRLEQAVASLAEAAVLQQKGVALNPGSRDVLEAPQALYSARSSVELEWMMPSRNDAAGAGAASQQEVAELRHLTANDPTDEVGRSLLATALYRESYALGGLQPARAVQLATEAVAMVDQQFTRIGTNRMRRARRNRALQRLAEAQLANGQLRDALRTNQAAVAQYRVLAHEGEGSFAELALVECFLDAAVIHTRMGNSSAALEDLEQAQMRAQGILAHMPGELTSILPVSLVEEAIATHWRARGDFAQARQHLAYALTLWQNYSDQNNYVKSQTLRLQRLAAAIP